MMPRAGGENVFMREAYGRLWGFLFGWMRFFIGTGGGRRARGRPRHLPQRRDRRCARAHDDRFDGRGSAPWRVGALEAVAIAAIALVTSSTAPASLGGPSRRSSRRSRSSSCRPGHLGVPLRPRRLGAPSQSGASGACEGVRPRPRRYGRSWRGDDGGDVGVQRMERADVRLWRVATPGESSPRAGRWLRHRRAAVRVRQLIVFSC